MTGLPSTLSRLLILAEDAAPAAATSKWGSTILRPHPLAWGIILGGLAFWLMLPRRSVKGRSLGVVLGIAALGCLGSRLLPLGDWSSNVVFWVLSAVTIVAAACTVTFRSPVYCAVWFAMTLMGTAGIFMVQGAQFLGVATIVVYAGAILVTFLFVLMLASPKGNAYYDRISWEALLAAITGAALMGILSVTIGKLNLDQATGPATATLQQDVLVPEHVARLGAELFGRHLIAVEVAGTLLLVALIGATAIVSGQKHGIAGSKTTTGEKSRARLLATNGEPQRELQEASR
jgi:NADH-quinone oxidoreductase subunit J